MYGVGGGECLIVSEMFHRNVGTAYPIVVSWDQLIFFVEVWGCCQVTYSRNQVLAGGRKLYIRQKSSHGSYSATSDFRGLCGCGPVLQELPKVRFPSFSVDVTMLEISEQEGRISVEFIPHFFFFSQMILVDICSSFLWISENLGFSNDSEVHHSWLRGLYISMFSFMFSCNMSL